MSDPGFLLRKTLSTEKGLCEWCFLLGNERELLMIPGPTMVSPRVLRILAKPILSHVSSEFVDGFAEALELQKKDKYKDYITEQYIENIYKSTPLHDIGKVGVPDEVLLKPGKLTAEEFEIMKRHSVIGGDAISSAVKLSGMKRSFLDMGKEIAYYHHEKWNGNGYPKGLMNDGIPLTARITALADVYDALTTKRVYKPAFPHEKAREILTEGFGTAFDPDIVEGFLSKENEFIKIKEEYRDKNGGS